MDKQPPATNRRIPPSRDPVVKALRRLLDATDRSIVAAQKVREARVDFAKVVEGQSRE